MCQLIWLTQDMCYKISKTEYTKCIPWWLSSKEPTCQCRRRGFNPWVGKLPWRRKWQPTPGFLLGKSQGQRSLAGCSPMGSQSLNNNKAGRIPKGGKHSKTFPSAPCLLLRLTFLVMAVHGSSPIVASGGYSLVAVCRLLIGVASLFEDHRL